MKVWAAVLLWLCSSASSSKGSSLVSSETCPIQTDSVSVRPDAPVQVGVLLDTHESGEGLFGCGRTSEPGIQAFEALRLGLNDVNRKGMVPGVSFGLRVFDSCGHKGSAVDQLTRLFPALRAGPKACSQTNTSLLAGVIDLTGVTTSPEVSEVLHDLYIPVLPVNPSSAAAPEDVAKILAEVAHDMTWERVSVIHTEDEYSVHVTKLLSQLTMAGQLCVASVHSIPTVDGFGRAKNAPELRVYRKILDSITTRLQDNTGVLIIGHGESVKRLLHTMADIPSAVSRLQWLLTSIPDPSVLAGLSEALNADRIFSLSPYPSSTDQIDKHWEQLASMDKFSLEDRWYLEYVMTKKRCVVQSLPGSEESSLPLCMSLTLPETPVEVLKRTAVSVPVLKALETFVQAVYTAWNTSCGGVAGLCPEMQSLTRRNFAGQFLDEESNAKGSRIPSLVEGGKTALTRYGFDYVRGAQYKQVIVYDNKKAQVIDPDFSYLKSKCPDENCNDCIRVRESRTDNQIIGQSDKIVIGRPDDVIIPLVLPIHKAGRSLLECSTEVNQKAIQDLEAALWILDRINSDSKFIPGVRLGARILDTCSSSLKASQRVSDFLTESMEVTGSPDINSALAVVVSGSSDESATAVTVASAMNLTTVSAVDVSSRIRHMGVDHFRFQIAVPPQTKAQAITEVLKYLGWEYVSVVYGRDSENLKEFEALKEALKNAGYCIAMEQQFAGSDLDEVQRVVSRLHLAKQRGARGVVLLTDTAAVQSLLTTVQNAIVEQSVQKGEFIWLGSGDWSYNLGAVQGLEDVAKGSILFSPFQSDISDFVTYFRRLRPESNKRNPFFEDFWHQTMKCVGKKCQAGTVLRYEASPSVVNIMQAILSIAAGLARLRNEKCTTSAEGICPNLIREPQIRNLLNHYIQFTASVRPDGKGDMFTFKQEGFGNTPVDIFNFRKVSPESFVYQKMGSYQESLSNLLSSVSYNSNGEETNLDQVASKCISDCSHCRKKSTDFLVLDSPTHLYIAASFGIHEATENPLQCSTKLSEQGVQHLEAFLWALDKFNLDPNRRFKLGAVVFDSCSSREKTAKDVSNFLSNSLASLGNGFQPPGAQNIAGFIQAGNNQVTSPIVDITMPLKITTVALSTSNAKYNKVFAYPYMLKLSLPNDVLADGLVSVLKFFRWKYVSVVYGSEDSNAKEIYQFFKAEAEKKNIRLALVEKFGEPSSDWNDRADTIVKRLKIKQLDGARGVVLLTTPAQTTLLLGAAQRLLDSHHLDRGDFLWLTLDNLEALHAYPDVSLGALTIKHSFVRLPVFRQHFGSLTLKNNTRNPWFREYWEQVHGCRGAACFGSLDLKQNAFFQDPGVPGVIDAFNIVANAVSSIWERVCRSDDGHSPCPELLESPEFRSLIFNMTKFGERQFNERNYAKESLDILNFRQVGSHSHTLITVGQYREEDGLTVNNSNVRGYDHQGREISLYDVPSECINSELCPRSTSNRQQSVMMMNPSERFVVGALMPIHKKGSTLFNCGPLEDQRMFQNLVAFSFAVNRVNANLTVLPSMRLGAMVLDYCQQRQKAEEKLYSYFSEENQFATSDVAPNSVLAMITFDDDVASDVSNILEAKDIPQINNPASSRMSRSVSDTSKTFRTVPSAMGQVDAVFSILARFGWRYVYVLHPDSDFGKAAREDFAKKAVEQGICVANYIQIEAMTTLQEMGQRLKDSLTDPQARVAVFLTDDPFTTRLVLQAAKDASLLPRFVWVGTEGWGQNLKAAEILEGTNVDAITIKLESYEIPEFKTYFSSLSLVNHDQIPDTWFEEFWQNHFHCQLPNSLTMQRQYTDVCTGRERLQPQMIQDKYVYHTVAAVESVAQGLDEFLRTKCLHGDAAMDIDDCGPDARKLLTPIIRKSLMGHDFACTDCPSKESAFGYQIFHLRNTSEGVYKYVKVGQWKDGVPRLDDSPYVFAEGEVPTSVCRGECLQCLTDVFEDISLPLEDQPREPLYSNFKTVWGIIVTALSVLGVVLVIICTLYFLMAFPVTVGTTVLGYMILFGLLVLYAVNFAFIVAPTEPTCGIRRFVMGLAYSIIFSGMLVKVMNTWRLMGYNGSRMMTDGTRMSSPAGLLVVAVGLVIIQIILTAAWLVLMPPKIGFYDATWRCAPPNSFEDELIISLVYVMLLLAVTILFSILTWKCQDNSREPRWILACCIFVGIVWLAWTLLSTQLPLRYRDVTIVIANLVCATLVMLCLYLRKVYLYSKLTRQVRDREQKTQLKPPNYPHSMYGTLQKNLSAVAPVLYGSQASLTGKPFYGGVGMGAFSHVALDEAQSETGGSTSSGSVQVQAADLYPLEMYDGGSHLSLYGNNNMLVLDDAVTHYAR